MKLESIFEGWTNQIRNGSVSAGGTCAVMFLVHEKFRVPCSANLPAEAKWRVEAIGKWIQDNLSPPSHYQTWLPQEEGIHAIYWANDTGQLDIEGFKTVEKLVCGYVPEESPSEAAGVEK